MTHPVIKIPPEDGRGCCFCVDISSITLLNRRDDRIGRRVFNVVSEAGVNHGLPFSHAVKVQNLPSTWLRSTSVSGFSPFTNDLRLKSGAALNF